jgi:hypothetical protein
MSDQVLEQTAVETPVQAPIEDLVTRASKVVVPAQPEKGESAPQDAIKLDQAAIDRIADPALKQAVIETHKSMQADYTRKTQDLASKRKEAEALKAQVEQDKYNIPNLLNDPKWVQVASEYQKTIKPQPTTSSNGDLTEEDFSYLPPEQQKSYLKMKQLEQGVQSLVSLAQSERMKNEDMTLKNRYANYEPQTVDRIYSDMMTGKLQATREHLWKVADYESAVNRAYQLGLQDRKLQTADKVAGSSQPTGVNVTPTNDAPAKLPNEGGIEYFKRLAVHNYNKLKGR